jgi:ABC-type Fe3+-siderophore transport system permease subunit
VRRVAPRTVALSGLAVTIAAVLVSMTLGVAHVPLADVAAAVGDLAAGTTSPGRTLVVDVRLPRAVGALCAGAALGTAGCALQALLRNPLASPFVIGSAQAAGFGAVLAISIGLPHVGTLALAFAMSVAAALLVLALSRTERSLPTESVVLTGLAVSLLFTALTGLVRFLAADEGVLGRIALWILGGLWQTTWTPLAAMAPLTLAAVAAMLLFARRLDLLALGESDAQRLGVRVRSTGTTVLLLSCLLASLAVCIAGVVAFVGLIVPHAARRLVGPAHAALLPASAFLGAVLVVATDTLARTAAPPQELPLSVVTSLIGVPCFLVLMRSLRARRSGA